ncbi:neuromedin-S isoform X2 [Dunckerocampus dactyliophorus]|uniref:neuromedin-S isoform X2 n=1 Tax=Dunckerocampus dactyliophorus TaxID=161453 RepID=UPI002405FE27|nr:neuromedin-S isoform X2 [Dunckerocampus dactyliophorus]
MNVPHVQHLALFCLFCFGYWSSTDARPYNGWEDDILFRKLRGVPSEDDSLSSWRRDEQQVQNLFKRFLFHYSKAKTSAGPEKNTSNSVHPLLRLSPKLSQRRKKTLVLLTI